jgi:hypothetical protein
MTPRVALGGPDVSHLLLPGALSNTSLDAGGESKGHPVAGVKM